MKGQRADSSSALEALASLARGTSPSWLMAVETFGGLAALAMMIWLPNMTLAPLLFGAVMLFGFWGLTEHLRRSPDIIVSRRARTSLRMVQSITAATGIVAVVAALYALLGSALGIFMS